MSSTAAPRRTGSVAAGVRLTRRGRLVLLALLVGLLLTAFTLGRTGDSAAAAGSASARTPYASTTVHEGETLWSVAKRIAPDRDPRALVQALRTLNHLDSASVQVGQQLLIPHGA